MHRGAEPSSSSQVYAKTMKVHELKTWPEFFEPIAKMEKTFELRKDDREFHVGDVLHLREWSPSGGYMGREMAKRVTYLLGGGVGWGVGMCVWLLVTLIGCLTIQIKRLRSTLP